MSEIISRGNTPLTSIVIPTWNGERHIGACLNSVFAHTSPRVEIIIVDNGSTDQTPALAQQVGSVTLIANHANMGFAHAVNQGLHQAHGDILVLMNQDVVAQPHWLEPIHQRFASEPSIGVVGSKLLYPDGRVQHAGGHLLEPAWEGIHYTNDSPTNRIDFVTGAVFAIRRSCWQAVGDFDEGFFPAYFEDVDYCLRVRKLAWQIAYEPKSILFHHESASRNEGLKLVANFHAQRIRLVLKHQPLDWIWNIFLPNEQVRILSGTTPEWRYGLAHVFLRSALSLPTLRSDISRTECNQLVNHLFALRDMAYDISLTSAL
jgi:O-antigen biosynthesis protein